MFCANDIEIVEYAPGENIYYVKKPAYSEYKKSVYFDMDGTIADFYRVPDWLELLRDFSTSPYRDAEATYDDFEAIVAMLHGLGYHVGICTWLSKVSNEQYDLETIEAKVGWLEDVFFDADEIVCASYGVPKHEMVCCPENALLIDDNATVRNDWYNPAHGRDAVDIYEMSVAIFGDDGSYDDLDPDDPFFEYYEDIANRLY